ncbi:MAG TPA: hypothetical protein VGI06_00080 [Acidimicrobiales bacterium]
MALVVGGMLCVAGAGAGVVLDQVPARADVAPGGDLGRYSLAATAPGEQITYDFPSATAHPQAEGEVPESVAQLTSGPQGYALATIAWPGSLAANAGSTAVLLGAPVPAQQAELANEGARAEARTGTSPSTVTNTGYPGASMTASATDTNVRADTTMAGSEGPSPGTSTGHVETTSAATVTGPAAVLATAASRVENVDLGGVVTITSVSSTAEASTDGVTTKAGGGTTVTGMKIGGQPGYVDDHGVHIGTVGSPVNAVASQIANQALAGAGMKIAVSQPSKSAQGANVMYDAGNLVVYWAVPGDPNGDTFTYTFGGASVTAGASPGFGTGPGGTGPAGGGPPVPTPQSGTGATAPVQAGASPAPLPPASPSATVPSAGRAIGSPLAVARLAGHPVLPRGLSPGLPVLAVLGSGLIGLGLWQLPDRVLDDTSTTCTGGGP